MCFAFDQKRGWAGARVPSKKTKGRRVTTDTDMVAAERGLWLVAVGVVVVGFSPRNARRSENEQRWKFVGQPWYTIGN